MKFFELNKKEKEILKDFEAGKFKSIGAIKKEASQYQEYAKQTLNKRRNININFLKEIYRKLKP